MGGVRSIKVSPPPPQPVAHVGLGLFDSASIKNHSESSGRAGKSNPPFGFDRPDRPVQYSHLSIMGKHKPLYSGGPLFLGFVFF